PATPRRACIVLSSIFADPRRICLDISGVAGRVMEGRPEKPDQPVVIAHQFAGGGLDRRSGPLRDAVAGEQRPPFRDRVDATLVGGGRTPRASVVVEGAEIPVSVPCACFDRLPEFLGTPRPA